MVVPGRGSMNAVPQDRSGQTWTLPLLLAGGCTVLVARLYMNEVWQPSLVIAATVLGAVGAAAAVLGAANPRWTAPFSVALGLVGALVILQVVVPLFLQVQLRRAHGPEFFIHDGALQMEEAVTMLEHGKNPYAESFAATPLARWSSGYTRGIPNPAIEHFIYLPGHLLMATVASKLAAPLGFYDDRFLTFTAYLAGVAVVWILAPNRWTRLTATTVVALNPLLVPYLTNGRNDSVVFLFLAVAFLFLARKRTTAAAVVFGLACTVKAFAWFLAPAFIVALVASAPGAGWWSRVRARALPLLLLVIVPVAIIGPFVLWNPSAFWDDVVRYPAGTSLTSYPISGGGLSEILLKTGIIHSKTDYFPFWIIELALLVPLCALLLPRLARSPRASLAAAFGTAFLFVGMYTSRFFNENYVGLLIFLAALSWVLFMRESVRSLA